MTFDELDHAKLSTLFARDDMAGGSGSGAPVYAGYRPEVREAPNGDTKIATCTACNGTGNRHRITLCSKCGGAGHVNVPNVDAGPAAKRFLHVALKYSPPAWAEAYLARAHWEACKVAEALGVPDAYYPRAENGTLRALEYPSAGHQLANGLQCRHCNQCVPLDDVCPTLAPGAGTAEHKDFDLFTIVLWRSHPADLERLAIPYDRPQCVTDNPAVLDRISPGLHIGELGELVGLGAATPHRVPARPYAQRSLIYFASPAGAAPLPAPVTFPADARHPARTVATCGEWQVERTARSRVYT